MRKTRGQLAVQRSADNPNGKYNTCSSGATIDAILPTPRTRATDATLESPCVRKENLSPISLSVQSGCCARPTARSVAQPGQEHVTAGAKAISKGLDAQDENVRREARKLRVHYSAGLAKGRLQFTKSSRDPVSVERLCRLVCNSTLGTQNIFVPLAAANH